MGVNTNLYEAKLKKNDEFFTQLSDVREELSNYTKHFKNKIVYCNCDNPITSAFWIYFYVNFKSLELKKLISTYYSDTTYKTEYNGINVVKIKLKGNGDFRSRECIEVLKESDIVVTNPPFSLFREYINVLMKYNKQFLIIGSLNSITYKDVFPLVKDNKIWLGYRPLNKDMYFNVLDDYKEWLIKNKKEGSAYKIINDVVMGRLASACWYTNLDHDKRHQNLKTEFLCKNKNYLKYDNFDIINVDKVKEIPMDYYGVMGVPITYIGVYNPSQFEILGIANSARWIGYECFTLIDNKRIYNRLLIRRKVDI